MALTATSASAQKIIHVFDGTAGFDFYGFSVRGAGDVDADGYPDVVVGALGYSQGGRTEVRSGRTGAVLHTFGALGFVDCSGAGDVDDDGFADVIVSDSGDFAGSGMAMVISGQTERVLHAFTGDAPGDYFGHSVSSAGDVDNDGFDDVVIGAPQFTTFNPGPGYAKVFSGQDGTLLHTFTGDSPGDSFGYSVRGAGDVDGDGFDDVIVGAPNDDDQGSQSGSARVFSGQTGQILHDLDGGAAQDWFGQSVGGAGDVNNDGRADFIAGAPGDDDFAMAAGSARVFSGLDGSPLHTFFGDAVGSALGANVAGAGDVDGNGFDDLIVAAGGGLSYARVYSGSDGAAIFTVPGINVGQVDGVGDVDGDGFDDVIVGDPIANAPEIGRAIVYSAQAIPPTVYCTAKQNSQGCLPQIGFSGAPSVTDPNPFDISATLVINNKNGILFYGTSGSLSAPFQGGLLCARPPLERTPVQGSGGSPPPDDCSGSFTFDFNAWIQSGNGSNLLVGRQVNGQYWHRDPLASFGSGLTNAIEFTIGP